MLLQLAQPSLNFILFLIFYTTHLLFKFQQQKYILPLSFSCGQWASPFLLSKFHRLNSFSCCCQRSASCCVARCELLVSTEASGVVKPFFEPFKGCRRAGCTCCAVNTFDAEMSQVEAAQKIYSQGILHDVINIDDDDDDDALVIIGEKNSRSNKGKTIEAIHQVLEVSDYTFFQPGVKYDLGLKKSTFKNSPWYDTQSDAKNNHVTDSSKPSWSLEPSNSKIQGSTMGSSSNLQIKMDNIDHTSGTMLSSPQLFSQAAPSKKNSAASQRGGRGLNLSLGVESSKSKRLSKCFFSKMKSASLASNPEARKLLHAGKPPAATKFKSAKKAGGSSISYNANFKDEILRKFHKFKQFDTVSDTSDHRFACENSSMKKHSKNWAKKIQKEWKILENDLPDAIFVRVYESRMDLLRAIIIGAEGTPYHDGLFFFDLYLPSDYPNVPPQVYFHNRCGSPKLNPNLHSGGGVCISLLNTWRGSKNECWLPRFSTILQVLVSIQGLVLNTKPIFNELSGLVRGTEAGESRSRLYNEEACISSLWTMIHMIRRPPKNFEDFVVEHFVSRAHDILGACKAYMEGAQVGSLVKGGVQDVDEGDKCCTQRFKNSLCEPMEELIREFARIGAKDCEKFLCYSKKSDLGITQPKNLACRVSMPYHHYLMWDFESYI